jgi:uncharacterized OB-fold protein
MTDRPLPSEAVVDILDQPFWDACNREEFVLDRCAVCGAYYWPASCCVEHGGTAMSWQPASGRGVVDTYTVFHRQYHPAFVPPYVVAVIRLVEGPYFHTNIVECDPDDVEVGMEVEVAFIDVSADEKLPVFRPVAR